MRLLSLFTLLLSMSSFGTLASLTLKEFNELVKSELSKDSKLKSVYKTVVNKYGCSENLDLGECRINKSLVEVPTLFQYYRGIEGGIYRGTLYYLEGATQSLRFGAIDIYFESDLDEKGKNTLKILEIKTNKPL